MTQAPPDRLNRLESSIERLVEVVTVMDKKLDVHIAKTDECLNSIETQISDFKSDTTERFNTLKSETDYKFNDLREDIKGIRSDVKGQDARLWGFVVALFLSLAGVIVKVVFFPQG